MFRKSSISDSTNINDSEFGEIKVIRNSGRYLRLNVRTNSQIVLSIPRRASIVQANRFLDESRASLRSTLAKLNSRNVISDGDIIGRHHKLIIREGLSPGIKLMDQSVTVTTVSGMDELAKQQLIHRGASKALRSEAERFLPKRIHSLASKFGYKYERLRLTYAKSRWGSCSTNGTISLNVALMNLPDELIDYVIMHELTHTHHMNHGRDFWNELESNLPGAKQLSAQLKSYSPYI